ncbi:type II toxin-antitoxin system RelE/ParE family toxin [Neorhizobium sp. T25_13]|uniref:type II toxin-antitoxin system RelE/ParE family toxin n=1 Tax=Neorhizobium sp. T25_13 TaxID=2093830 RepID=UPI000CF85ABE|nr:type II toxin-antitoxin system RelE/ParE family toxin [Neorhizobium sp. T25_13]
MIVVITSEAEEDFERIGDYIAQFNPSRAESFVEELLLRCQNLARMPFRFPLLSRLQHADIRRVPHGNYVIYYRVDDANVYILNILNAAQDYEAILFPDD